MANVELDYMEYSSDANAQAAYVSNAVYGSNVITGGTPTADSELNSSRAATKAVDGDTVTLWTSTNTAFPHWWKYDLGSGVTKVITKISIETNEISVIPIGPPDVYTTIKDFTFKGSNDNSNWDTLYTGVVVGAYGMQDYTFTNTTAYRYFLVNITSNYRGDSYAGFFEIQGFENCLKAYSESTIKTQGTYSLKGVAAITDSLNKTLTRTIT